MYFTIFPITEGLRCPYVHNLLKKLSKQQGFVLISSNDCNMFLVVTEQFSYDLLRNILRD